jgi:hypothetical protein
MAISLWIPIGYRNPLAETIDMTPRYALAALVLTLVAPAFVAAAPAPAKDSPLSETTIQSLSQSMRGFLVETLPTPLYNKSDNWGHTRPTTNGVKWKGKGLKVHPELLKAEKNDGVWTRLVLTAPNLRNNTILELRNFQHTSQGTTTFDVFLAFDGNAEYERQSWKGGVRVYGGSARVRFRVKLRMQCEVTSRLEKNGAGIPDLVFRLRVINADLSYDNLVCEHVMGIGGDAARLIGEAVRSGVRRFHPSLERALLARANTAIVKSADTKDVRVSLGKVLGQ